MRTNKVEEPVDTQENAARVRTRCARLLRGGTPEAFSRDMLKKRTDARTVERYLGALEYWRC